MLSHPSATVAFIALFLVNCAYTQSASNEHLNLELPNHSTDPAERIGWYSPPNLRGTIDIIWSCTTTLLLCSWSVLCVNVPARGETEKRLYFRKTLLTGLCLLGPEFIFQAALGQWVSARESVRLFHASGITDWTVTHGFYADMGGILFLARDFPRSFPVDSKQLHYLVINKYVDYPKIDKADIQEKNKVDLPIRLITFVQTIWFTINLCSRAAQGLAVTTLEITTIAFVACTFGTVFCWWYKPADVKTPHEVHCNVPLAQILTEAGDSARQTYNYTPLDFISRKEWCWSLFWSHWTNILRCMGIHFASTERPIKRIQTTQFLEIKGWPYVSFLFVSALYLSIFFAAWNFSFPTRLEQAFWRAACIMAMISLILYAAVAEWGFKSINSNQRRHLDVEMHTSPVGDVEATEPEKKVEQNWWHQRLHAAARCMRNNSLLKDPMLDVPLTAIIPTYILGPLYCLARLYVWVADIIELRSLPASAYASVNWSEFWPHF